MSYRGTDFLKKLEGTLNSNRHIDILYYYSLPSAHLETISFFFRTTKHHVTDRELFKIRRLTIIWGEWPPQSSYFYNLWHDLELGREMFQVLNDEWGNISVQRCQGHIRSMSHLMYAKQSLVLMEDLQNTDDEMTKTKIKISLYFYENFKYFPIHLS